MYKLIEFVNCIAYSEVGTCEFLWRSGPEYFVNYCPNDAMISTLIPSAPLSCFAPIASRNGATSEGPYRPYDPSRSPRRSQHATSSRPRHLRRRRLDPRPPHHRLRLPPLRRQPPAPPRRAPHRSAPARPGSRRRARDLAHRALGRRPAAADVRVRRGDARRAGARARAARRRRAPARRGRGRSRRSGPPRRRRVPRRGR